jgi:hypothetical protein
VNDNPFANQPIYGRDVTSIMRDINKIEAKMVSDTGNIDIVIAIDCTGSMGSTIANVKANAQQIAQRIRERAPTTWFGAIKFRDYGDAFITQVVSQPGESIADFEAAINTMAAAGGGDWAEAYVEVVYQAAQEVVWRQGSMRLLIILGDAPPHDPVYGTGTSGSGHTWAQAAQTASNAEVIVSMIAVGQGVGNATVRHSYQDMTTATDGIYMESSDPEQVSDAIIELFNIIAVTQTPFFGYTLTDKIALGTPDGGILVPADNALRTAWAELVPNHILDMRSAVERILSYGYWENPDTNQPYNWTDNSPDNLYFIAMGDRLGYGATGGARYAWTRSLAQMVGSPPVDLDIGEVYECVRVLKLAAGVE